MFGEIPATNTSRLFDHGDNKFRAIHVNSPVSIQTTTNAYLTNDADCYTKTQVNRCLALKQNVISNLARPGEQILEASLLKRIFAVARLQIKNIFKSERFKRSKKC